MTFLPGPAFRSRARNRSLERIEAIAAWTEMLRDVLSAGGGLEQSIVVTAEGGGVTHTTGYTLTVESPPPGFDFTLSVNPAAGTVYRANLPDV